MILFQVFKQASLCLLFGKILDFICIFPEDNLQSKFAGFCMKVNGSAFKKAREEIRKDTQVSDKLRGESAVGTQEWLASKAQIRSKSGELKPLSVRTIQYLERGSASIDVVDAVSPHLKINGRELIIGYGKDSVDADFPSYIDFRPTISPADSLESFQLSPVLMTLDPMLIDFDSDDLESIKLRSITAIVKFEEGLLINYVWLYKVMLIPGGKGWLGIDEEISPIKMSQPSHYKASIMFKQSILPYLSWSDFIKIIEQTNDNMLKVTINMNFITFEKEFKIGVSVSQARTLIKSSKQRFKCTYPVYIQPDALTWR